MNKKNWKVFRGEREKHKRERERERESTDACSVVKVTGYEHSWCPKTCRFGHLMGCENEFVPMYEKGKWREKDRKKERERERERKREITCTSYAQCPSEGMSRMNGNMRVEWWNCEGIWHSNSVQQTLSLTIRLKLPYVCVKFVNEGPRLLWERESEWESERVRRERKERR